jgi:pSer/pThr/pTyr-binding forkhead associated (FHA) protein
MNRDEFVSPFFVMLMNNQTRQPICTIKKPGSFSVGRKNSQKPSDVQITTNDVYLSGQHFIIIVTPRKEVIIKDNGSVNGTSVLNKRSKEFLTLKSNEEVLLANGDIFKAGETEFLIKLPEVQKTPQASNSSQSNKTTIIKLK